MAFSSFLNKKVHGSLHFNHLMLINPFRPLDDGEIIDLKVSYLNAIGALSNLANCTNSNVVFLINFLVRYSPSPIRRYWNNVKYIFRYHHNTTYMIILFNKKYFLVKYRDAEYRFDPYKVKSQTCYVFI